MEIKNDGKSITSLSVSNYSLAKLLLSFTSILSKFVRLPTQSLVNKHSRITI